MLAIVSAVTRAAVLHGVGAATMHILVVEDETDIAAMIADQLSRSGFVPHQTNTIAEAHKQLSARIFPLTLLDRRLPDGDGLSLVPFIRTTQPGARVMVLTALDAICDKVRGLDAGADDYLTKPFDADELMARVRATLRRPGGESLPPIVCGGVCYEPSSRAVTVRGEPFMLHGLELMLLECLLRHLHRTAPRRVLIREVYGFAKCVGHSNVLDSLVSRLRKRLCAVSAGVAIHPVRGVGYILTDADR